MAASSCISSCMNDVVVHLPIRRLGSCNNYARLSSEPLLGESGRFASFEEQCGGGGRAGGHPKVVDSISCRQLYLRSYTFSRKESFNDKTKRRIGKVAECVVRRTGLGRFRLLTRGGGGEGKRKKKKAKKGKGKGKGVVVRSRSTAVMCLRKARRVTCTAVMKVVRRLMMSCTTRVDTAADGD